MLNIPCLTLRSNTERPITISRGTNTLVGNDTERIVREAFKIIDDGGKKGKSPQLWDGRTAERIIQILGSKFQDLCLKRELIGQNSEHKS